MVQTRGDAQGPGWELCLMLKWTTAPRAMQARAAPEGPAVVVAGWLISPLWANKWRLGLSAWCTVHRLAGLEQRARHSVSSVHCRYLPLASQRGTPGVRRKIPPSVGTWEMLADNDVEENGLLHAWKFSPVHLPTHWEHRTDCPVPWFWLLCSLHMGDTYLAEAPEHLSRVGGPGGCLVIAELKWRGAKVRDFLKIKSDSESL